MPKTEQWMRGLAMEILNCMFPSPQMCEKGPLLPQLDEIIASEYEKAHAPATPATPCGEFMCRVNNDWDMLCNADKGHDGQHSFTMPMQVAEAAPTGKWSQYMAEVLPCGHTNAQHEYFLDGEVKLIACQVVKSEAAPTADGPMRDELLKELELWGIIYDPQQVEAGEEPWEVIAEPEPQYFYTFAEAFKFFNSLQDNPETLPSPPAGQGRGE